MIHRWVPVLPVLWVGTGLFVACYAWTNVHQFPESVPVHWNFEGIADRFVPRESLFWHLFAFPLLQLGLLAVGILLPWISPRAYKVSLEQPAVTWIFSLVSLLFLCLQILITLSMAGILTGDMMTRCLMGLLGLFFGAMGPFLPSIPRNFYVGIRTPWTLADDQVWAGTHQFGAWSFSLAGLVAILSALFLPNFWVLLATLVGGALAPVVYSFWLSKKRESQQSLT